MRFIYFFFIQLFFILALQASCANDFDISWDKYGASKAYGFLSRNSQPHKVNETNLAKELSSKKQLREIKKIPKGKTIVDYFENLYPKINSFKLLIAVTKKLNQMGISY